MATLDSLPPDQRAVLQLVLQRGRSYDEIARLLSMNRASVRDRALRAFDALGPQTGVGDQRRALITDYLLGQLPPAVTTEVRDHLAESAPERAWARVLAAELSPLTSMSLPEIPSDGAGAPASAPAADAGGKKKRESIFRRRRDRKGATPARAAEPMPPSKVPDVPDRAPRSSRVGGAILIGIAVLVVVAVVVVVLASGGSTAKHPAAATTTASTSGAAASATTGTGSTGAKVVAQINLTPAKSGSKAAGIAEILKEGASDGIAVVAQNVPANTTKPPNAYAIWLYNSAKDAHRLGFVNPGVSSNGKLSTAGGLPSNANHFKQVIVTLETTAHPVTPGTIVLHGVLSGL
jgi:hypothetical protein